MYRSKVILEGVFMIGKIIKEQRLLLGMSRKTLAEDICSEKYVYLIETEERNPSAYILNDLSDRLGLDLFKYYQYSNYDQKEKVLKHRQNFERYTQTSDVEKLYEEAQEASKLSDFQKEPLIYDIQIIEFAYESIIQGKRKEAIIGLREIIETEKINIDNIALINAYAALASTYQLEGQWSKAREIVIVAYELIKNKTEFPRYHTVIITVLFLMISSLYSLGEYEESIEYSTLLKDFQEKHSEYNRLYYVDFYLSFAYCKIGEREKAFDHFMRGIYSALLFKNKVDIYFITQMPEFTEISESLEINPKFINQLYAILQNEN